MSLTTYPFFYSALNLRTACGIPSGPTFTVICPFFVYSRSRPSPAVSSITFILRIGIGIFQRGISRPECSRNTPDYQLHIKNYPVRSTTQKIDLLPDRLTTYRAKDIDGMQVIHQTVGPWTIHTFTHIASSFINP